MKQERAQFIKAHAERLVAQSDVMAGRLVSVAAVESALLDLESVVKNSRDTICGPAKTGGRLDRLQTADLGAWLFEFCVAKGLDIIVDARREVDAEIARQRSGKDA